MAPLRSFFAAGLAAILASVVLAAPLESSDIANTGSDVAVVGEISEALSKQYADAEALVANATIEEAIATAEAHIGGKQIPDSYVSAEYTEVPGSPYLEMAHVVFIRTTATPSKDYKVWVTWGTGVVVGQKEISWPCPNVICV